MKKLMIYNHGKDSIPWGEKALAMAEVAKRCGHDVLSPDYTAGNDPDMRVKQLLAQDIVGYDKIVLVGSSMGAYVATVAADMLGSSDIFLLAPAFYLPGYQCREFSPPVHTMVIHGWQDDVVPPDNAWRFCQQHLKWQAGETCSRHDQEMFLTSDNRIDRAEQLFKEAEAAGAIRNNRLRDKIRYSRALVSRGIAPESLQANENDIASGIDAVREKLDEASSALGAGNEGDKRAETLDKARRLARGLESLQERTRERAERDQQGQGQQGQQGQNGEQGQGQQGQQGQGQGQGRTERPGDARSPADVDVVDHRPTTLGVCCEFPHERGPP